jgi:Tol biopolymer transport system component
VAGIIPLTTYPGEETLPTFSPDGIRVAFAWNGEKRDNWDIYITQLDAQTPLALTTDPARDRGPAWSPDSTHIAFVREQSDTSAAIYLTPPMPGSAKKIADIRPVWLVERTTLSWFPDSKRLVVAELQADGQTSGISIIPIGPGERRQLLSNPLTAGTHFFPAVSPDGKALAYSLCRASNSCDLLQVDLGADSMPIGQPKQLTFQGADIKGIAWAADGKSVIYGSSLGGVSLWRMRIDGKAPERLELAARAAGYPAVSLSGNRLAYPAGSKDVNLWKLEPGKPPESVSSSTQQDFDPQLSKDGKRIAFATDRSARGNEIWTANIDGSKLNRLAEATGRAQGSPRWSPDGRWIAFDAQAEDGQRDILVIDSAGGPQRRLTPYPSNEIRPSWSSDGKWIYFQSNRSGQGEIWRMPSGGGEAVQMTTGGGSNPMESTDGETLFYQKKDVVIAKPLKGGPERPVLHSISGWEYFPFEKGIYYVVKPNPQVAVLELRFLTLASGKVDVLNTYQSLGGQGLSVSPDGKTIIVAGVEPSGAEDLMLIQNFR